jgi:hypothetical protein
VHNSKQTGWILFETLLASMIGFLVLAGATEFFFSSCHFVNQLMAQWYRLGQFEKWRLWMHDLLNVELNQLRCGNNQTIAVLKITHNAFSVRSCRWIDGRWQWLTTDYYLRKKKGVSYLYEKTGVEPSVAWIAGVKALRATLATSTTRANCQNLVVDWVLSDTYQPLLDSHFVFGWCNKTKGQFSAK